MMVNAVMRAVAGSIALLLGVLLASSALAANNGAANPADVRSVMHIDSPLAPGEFAWDADGVPPGRMWIVVDLARERIHVYRGGTEIGRAAIIFGDDDKPTPTGTFPILQKRAVHFSNLYNNAPMPFMLRLTWDGIAIHGSNVDPGAITHGCVGVPVDFAEILFPHIKLGDRVTVTRNWMPEVYG